MLPCCAALSLKQQQMRSSAVGSRHKHLQINLLSIIFKTILCFHNELNLDTASRCATYGARDEETFNAPFVIPCFGMPQLNWPCNVVKTREQARRTLGHNLNSMSSNMNMFDTHNQFQLYLHPPALPRNIIDDWVSPAIATSTHSSSNVSFIVACR